MHWALSLVLPTYFALRTLAFSHCKTLNVKSSRATKTKRLFRYSKGDSHSVCVGSNDMRNAWSLETFQPWSIVVGDIMRAICDLVPCVVGVVSRTTLSSYVAKPATVVWSPRFEYCDASIMVATYRSVCEAHWLAVRCVLISIAVPSKVVLYPSIVFIVANATEPL